MSINPPYHRRFVSVSRLFSVIILALVHGYYPPAGLAEEAALLSPDQRLVVEHASEVRVSPLQPMALLPSALPPMFWGESRKVLASQKKTISSLLIKAETIDVNKRLSQCHYMPGAKFTFLPGNLTVLLCMNCDVWALGPDPALSPGNLALPEGMKFGDSQRNREGLVTLLNELFGENFLKPGQYTP